MSKRFHPKCGKNPKQKRDLVTISLKQVLPAHLLCVMLVIHQTYNLLERQETVANVPGGG